MDQVQPAASNPLVSAIRATRDFLVAARFEMTKVSWPTRDELMKATRMIVVASMVLGLVIGLVDWVLQLIFVSGIAALAR